MNGFPDITLSEAKDMMKTLSDEMSLLLLSPPGLGKSDIVQQAAAEAGLVCRSLVGTQIAPEDVSGVPRIENERTRFYPPRLLLSDNQEPFVLFLDELPASPSEVQKSLYPIFNERRIGEFPLPKGTWVVAAGNRLEDRSLVRPLSAALVNRVIILNVKVDVVEWLRYASRTKVRSDIMAFIAFRPDALMREVPSMPSPFSTPRAWVNYSRSLDRLEQAGLLTQTSANALAYGLLSPEDAAMFPVFLSSNVGLLHPPLTYLNGRSALPTDPTRRWFVLHGIRQLFLTQWEVLKKKTTPARIQAFLLDKVSREERTAVMLGLVEKWGQLGADRAICQTIEEITGISIEE
ncbi:MAG: AAA family ATPase [Thermoguttaceae bacterium]|nr:AAA family ATPase [Thermoguttaceae bacterium]